MKKLFLVILFIFALTFQGSAEVDLGQVYDKAPAEAKTVIESEKVNDFEYYISLLSPLKFFKFIGGLISKGFKSTYRNFSSLLILIIVIFIADSIMHGFTNKSLNTSFNIVAATSVSLCVYTAVKAAYLQAFTAIYSIAIFQQSLMAVMAAMLASQGNTLSGSVLPASIMYAVGVITQINNYVFIPMINIFFVIALVEGIYSGTGLTEIAESIKKVINWGLGFCTTLLVGLLSIQKNLTTASDNVLTGAVKFTVASFLPIVGGAMKEAYVTFVSSMGIIKTAAGSLGIIIIIAVMLPIITKIVLCSFIFKVFHSFSKVSGNTKISAVLNRVSTVWDLLSVIIICESIFLIISIGVLIGIGGRTI